MQASAVACVRHLIEEYRRTLCRLTRLPEQLLKSPAYGARQTSPLDSDLVFSDSMRTVSETVQGVRHEASGLRPCPFLAVSLVPGDLL